jgi:hypothetical protein
MRIGVTLLLLCLFPAAVRADADSDYAALVAKADAGDATIDYTALRNAYVQSSGYDPYGMDWRGLRNDGFAALQAKDCATALAKADSILKLDYTSVDGHLLRGNCARQNGDATADAHEFAIIKGLMGSVTGSGDGKSADTAYVVTTMAEEQFLLLSARTREAGQALLQTGKGPVDQITAVDFTNGAKSIVYFNVNALFIGMARKFQGKQVSPITP